LLLAIRASEEKLFSPLKIAFFSGFFRVEADVDSFGRWAYSRKPMKLVRYLFVFTLLSAPTGAIAGTSYSDANTTDNPYAQYDPDGVPLTITQGRRRRPPSAAEMEATRKAQAQIAYERNWLLRGYEEQLRLRQAQSSPDRNQSGNLYYQLSINRDLAKLAGLPDLSSNDAAGALLLRADGSAASSHPTTLRPDASSDAKTEPLTLSNYKPLIPQMGVYNSSGTNHSYSTSLVSSYFSNNNPSTPTPESPKPTTAPSVDAVDLQTPGMVAAKGDALSDPNLTDLTIDTLPGETIDQAKARIDANNNPQLPVVMDADELHRQQDAQLNPAGVAKPPTQALTQEPPIAQPISPPVNPAPLPVSRLPQINSHPIKDPYDILNR
jgi:hypothetical protein